MLQQQGGQKTGFFRGCIVPVLGVIGFILLCFVFCEVIFLVGSSNSNSNSGTGGQVIFHFASWVLDYGLPAV